MTVTDMTSLTNILGISRERGPRLKWALLRIAPLWLVASVTLTGCGSEPNAEDADDSSKPLLPWTVGNVWKYTVTESDGSVSSKTTTVQGLEPIPAGPNMGKMANRVITRKGTDEADRTESFQAPDPDAPQRILRYHESSYGAVSGNLQLVEYWAPWRIHIDGTPERTQEGASFTLNYDETKLDGGDINSATSHHVSDRWVVLEANVTVVAGGKSYPHAIHFQKTGGQDAKHYWYVRGIGKVKETGTQTEELSSYTVAPE